MQNDLLAVFELNKLNKQSEDLFSQKPGSGPYVLISKHKYCVVCVCALHVTSANVDKCPIMNHNSFEPLLSKVIFFV